MKAFLTALIFLFCVLHCYAQDNSSWQVMNEGIGWTNSIDFIDQNTGWMAVDNKLYKTEDSGESWSTVTLPENFYIEQIDFISNLVGWAIASTNENWIRNVYKTEDSGTSWQRYSNLAENHDLRYMQVVTDSIIYLSGNVNNTDYCTVWIYKTSDGGKSWHDITPASPTNRIDPDGAYFFDTQKGFVSGQCDGILKILKTDNGGDTWQEKTISTLEFFRSFQIINDSTIIFSATQKESGNIIAKTTDIFENWEIKSQYDNEIISCFAVDEKTLFSIMADTLWDFYVMKSSDGGATWQEKQKIWQSVDRLYFFSEQLGFIVGNGYYRTIDGGENWILTNFSEWFGTIFFVDKNLGFAGSQMCRHGCWGNLFMTNDGGKTWSYRASTLVSSIVFVDDFTGYHINYWSIIKTTDKGMNWGKVYENKSDSNGYNIGLNRLGFMDEQTGWAVGYAEWSDSNGAGILATNNGGENWDLVWKYSNTEDQRYDLNDIFIFDTTAWAVGEAGMIVKYSRNKDWQKMPSVTGFSLFDVFFKDQQYGWITGMDWANDKNFILKTNNKGQSWQKIPVINYRINDLFFADSLNGWAVGNDTSYSGVILKTADGGKNWQPVVEHLSSYLNVLHFKDGILWAAGGNGLILRTDNWTTWIDQNTGEIYPQKFHLSQNYPNPFNTQTTISYTIDNVRTRHAVSQHVELSIYNLLGQKVATLVDKKQPAGSYTVQWDASGFSSGVYIYRFEEGKYNDVKKLILLK